MNWTHQEIRYPGEEINQAEENEQFNEVTSIERKEICQVQILKKSNIQCLALYI